MIASPAVNMMFVKYLLYNLNRQLNMALKRKGKGERRKQEPMLFNIIGKHKQQYK